LPTRGEVPLREGAGGSEKSRFSSELFVGIVKIVTKRRILKKEGKRREG